jgi:glycosyltransferase involved in cell wall biosynthesis
MKIAFDYQIFTQQEYGGISRYFVRLANELIAMNEDLRVFAPIYRNRYVKDLPEKNVVGREIKKLPAKSIRLCAALNRYMGGCEIKRFSPRILHETYYSGHPLNVKGAARVLTVYDMIHEKFADKFPDRDKTSHYKRVAVERADHIISISHSTKRDLCDMFGVSPKKVSVVHLGFDKFSETAKQAFSIIGNQPFLLFVGNRNGYKNFEGLLRAVASRKELRENFDIISFGGSSFNSSEKNLIQSLGLREGSVHHFNGADSRLGYLYKFASAFVYPSLYEGFGLPPLEAMAHRCPVVTSNTSSMPEVVGLAGEYFTPVNIEEQAQAICNVVFDETRRDTLVQLGTERLKDFSWRTCADQTRDVYEGI